MTRCDIFANGLGLKWLGWLFALLGNIAAFCIGSMVQSNSVAVALKKTWQVLEVFSGLVLAVLTGVVNICGIRRIGRVT